MARKLLSPALMMQRNPTNNVVDCRNRGVPSAGTTRDTRNSLLAKKAALEFMASERLDAAGRLAAWIAHQINNPLGAISGNAQLLARRLQRDIGDPEALGAYMSYLEAVQNQTERCVRITAEALNFTQFGEPDPRRLSVLDVVSDAVELVRYGHPESCVNLSAPAASKCLETRADREWLTRAVFEVLANAVQASGSRPVEIAVGVERKPRLPAVASAKVGRPSEIRIGVSVAGRGYLRMCCPGSSTPSSRLRMTLGDWA